MEDVLAALDGKLPAKTGTGPAPSNIISTGSVIEDLGALVEANKGVPQDVLALAAKAAHAVDELAEAKDKAGDLKDRLKDAMNAAKVTLVQLPDRDAIKFSTSKGGAKQKTLKAITATMEAAEVRLAKERAQTEEREATAKEVKIAASFGRAKAEKLWNALPTSGGGKTTLKIPERKAEEPKPL